MFDEKSRLGLRLHQTSRLEFHESLDSRAHADVMLIAHGAQGGSALTRTEHAVTDQLRHCVGDLDVERQLSHGSYKGGRNGSLTNGKTMPAPCGSARRAWLALVTMEGVVLKESAMRNGWRF